MNAASDTDALAKLSHYVKVRCPGEERLALATLRALARVGSDVVMERRIRAYLGGAIQGIVAGHIEPRVCRGQLRDALRRFRVTVHSGSSASWRALQASLFDAISSEGDRHFYCRDEVPSGTTEKALTFQCADAAALLAWTGARTETPHGLAVKVKAGGTLRGATVGLPHRAVWLTQYTGVAEEIIEQARSRPDADLARRVREIVGQSGWRPGQTVVAFISSKPLASLLFDAGSTARRPVGPTRLEAQTHRHFRHWPPSTHVDKYGRTYDLNPVSRRAAGSLGHGVPEAVRPAVPINAFDDCVVIGTLTRDGCRVTEPDDAFLVDVGADAPVFDVMRRMVRAL